MPFFKPKPPITQDEFDWLVACFAWLRGVLGDAHIRPDFVLPDHPDLLAAKTGPQLFEAVRGIAGMEQWPCRLQKVDVDDPASSPHITYEGSAACGTFSVENGEAIIRYSSQMLRDPDALTATFAHELCHYLLVNAGDPPGGAELMEHATDCAAVYIGFGVFLANSARSFEQGNDGEISWWRSSANGYLSEQALVTATALFAALHGYETGAADEALKPYLRRSMTKAGKVITHRYPDVAAAMDQVNLLEWNYA
ncbi:hypothetical protein [Erythrobacter crassostreae]|uniref:Uncharacterized protein n=1 Tax=Erythrobacter crassostreae TaxID=2828328 RepID=A0A9X1JPC2_9SPHN|nr:hypothetical protein [Erythrobacter crassostrea]MBV7259282.1 hypothetical protein [Erythrobacter crassostrea]